MGKYFGTDGIRGIYQEDLTIELAYKLGASIAQCLGPKTLVIGMDTRASSRDLVEAVIQGYKTISDYIIIAGVCSTPMIAHYAKLKNITGVMITASHNPYMYNGIKVFHKGFKLSKDEEFMIEERMDSILYKELKSLDMKVSLEVKNAYLKIYEDLSLPEVNLNLGLDCAHGATFEIAPYVFSKITHSLSIIGATPDGYNINKGVGSTEPQALMDLVKEQNLDLGFAFDGDGDRIFVIDHEGIIYDGDLLVYVIASYLKDKQLLKHNKVVLTKMSNPGLLKALNEKGIDYILTDVGDKYVAEALFKEDLSIGGESSGHLIMPHLLHSGDGVLVATFILKILSETNKTLKEIISNVSIYPFELINLKNVDKAILNEPFIQDEIKQVKEILGFDSLLLIRPSGTEPLLRIAISHKDQNLMKDCLNKLTKLLKKEG